MHSVVIKQKEHYRYKMYFE